MVVYCCWTDVFRCQMMEFSENRDSHSIRSVDPEGTCCGGVELVLYN